MGDCVCTCFVLFFCGSTHDRHANKTENVCAKFSNGVTCVLVSRACQHTPPIWQNEWQFGIDRWSSICASNLAAVRQNLYQRIAHEWCLEIAKMPLKWPHFFSSYLSVYALSGLFLSTFGRSHPTSSLPSMEENDKKNVLGAYRGKSRKYDLQVGAHSIPVFQC